MIKLPPVEEPAEYNENYIFYWNHVGLELNRLAHSIGGPQTGPTLSARVLGILHLAIHDAYFAIHPSAPAPFATYLPDSPMPGVPPLPDLPGDRDQKSAVAGAAITILEAHYAKRNISSNFAFAVSDQLDQLLTQLIAGHPGHIDALSESYQFGVDVAGAMLSLLAIKPDEPGADAGRYTPKEGRFQFRDEPGNPVRLAPVNPNDPAGPKRAFRPYHAPFYGMTAKRFATHADHVIADPPKDTNPATAAEYIEALREVRVLGGAPTQNSTLRTPDQTVAAYYWAYDGANLIGTPPRLYNQIVRKIAWGRKHSGARQAQRNNDEYVRLFALVNTAMSDAGIFAWREKYCFEFWRPLPGVREHDTATGPGPISQTGNEKLDGNADPFWQALGAPETNTEKVSFKPPFPAYPSGHATFGAAAFQMVRLFYRTRDNLGFGPGEPDEIGFSFVSEELNGVSRDLRQPYVPDEPITDQPGLVRTRVVRRFKSLWAAILENGASRVWLGVHWRFDAFAAADVVAATDPDNGSTVYKDSDDVRYNATGTRSDRSGDFPIGGIPLGLAIANDIYDNGMQPTPKNLQPVGRKKCGLDDFPADDTADAVTQQSIIVPKATETNIR